MVFLLLFGVATSPATALAAGHRYPYYQCGTYRAGQ